MDAPPRVLHDPGAAHRKSRLTIVATLNASLSLFLYCRRMATNSINSFRAFIALALCNIASRPAFSNDAELRYYLRSPCPSWHVVAASDHRRGYRRKYLLQPAFAGCFSTFFSRASLMGRIGASADAAGFRTRDATPCSLGRSIRPAEVDVGTSHCNVRDPDRRRHGAQPGGTDFRKSCDGRHRAHPSACAAICSRAFALL